MKKIIFLVLILTSSICAYSFCYIPVGVNPQNGFNLSDQSPSPNFLSSYAKASFSCTPGNNFSTPILVWKLKCGQNPVQLTYSEMKGHLTDVKMYCKITAQKYNCDGTWAGPQTSLFTTPVTEYTVEGYSDDITTTFELTVEPNTVYRAFSYTKHKFLGFWTAFVERPSHKSIIFAESDEFPDPNGNFADVLSVIPKTSTGTGWTVDVHQLDASGSFKFDATTTNCENKWKYEISKFNLNAWTSSNIVTSPWITGEAGIINMNTFYTYGFERNKLYLLKLIAGNGWYEKYYWFEIKDAKLKGTISGTPITETVNSPWGLFDFTLNRLCFGNLIKLNTTGTESADTYKVKITPLNAMYNSAGPTVTYGPFVGPVPTEIDLPMAYGSPFLLNQRYSVRYIITSPSIEQQYFFKYIDCGAYKQSVSNIKEDEKNENDISIYPNPVNAWVNIKVNTTVEIGSTYTIRVMDILGREVYKNTLSESDTRIDMSSWVPGNYIFTIQYGNKIITRKVTKN